MCWRMSNYLMNWIRKKLMSFVLCLMTNTCHLLRFLVCPRKGSPLPHTSAFFLNWSLWPRSNKLYFQVILGICFFTTIYLFFMIIFGCSVSFTAYYLIFVFFFYYCPKIVRFIGVSSFFFLYLKQIQYIISQVPFKLFLVRDFHIERSFSYVS